MSIVQPLTGPWISVSGPIIVFSNFWTIEIERVNGEGTLFLGKKSKLNQFGEMCKDPTNQKFQVKKEDDLKVRILKCVFNKQYSFEGFLGRHGVSVSPRFPKQS